MQCNAVFHIHGYNGSTLHVGSPLLGRMIFPLRLALDTCIPKGMMTIFSCTLEGPEDDHPSVDADAGGQV